MKPTTLLAPMPGWLGSLAEVPDPVFAEGMMGSGVAIDPLEGMVSAPCDGTVILVAPTGHSITLRSAQGAELMIHIGLETVALGAGAFQPLVRDGQAVKAGDPLVAFDLDAVGLRAKSLVTPILLTSESGFEFVPANTGALVQRKAPIGTIRATAVSDAGADVAPAEQDAQHSATVRVSLVHGVHARPAARIAACAKHFRSDVQLETAGRRASARSPVALMALDVRRDDTLDIIAHGSDSAAAVAAVKALIETGFDEPAAPTVIALRAGKGGANDFTGVSAVPGKAVGIAVHWQPPLPDIRETGATTAVELARFEGALAKVRGTLSAAATSAVAGSIATAQQALLDDDELKAPARLLIDEGKSAAFAWRQAIAQTAQRFRATGNPLIQERVEDLADLERQLLFALVGAAPQVMALPDRSVLIANELLPSELMSLDRGKLVGLCLMRSGPTSHAALIAASIGVPTLVAMGPRVMEIATGTPVFLDGAAGKLIVEPDPSLIAQALAPSPAAVPVTGECATANGERVAILANLGAVAEAAAAVAAGAEGCGLLRTEFLFLERTSPPGEDEQLTAYQAIADALDERPLTIRTLDIGGDKPVPYLALPREDNPALGVRGIRAGLAQPELLDPQLRAIVRVRGAARPRIMLPMVATIAELRAVRARLDALDGAENIELGIMIETPAAALLAAQLAAEADFFSIGSNDLTQYALAMDRTNPLLAAEVDAFHPAVLRLIALTVEGSARHAKPVAVCGGLASDPMGALLLLGLGIREFSVVPAAIGAIKSAIRTASIDACRRIAAQALEAETAAAVRSLVHSLPSGGGGQ